MKNIVFIIQKELLELKSSRQLVFHIIVQSIAFGAIFPLITWLMMSGVLPVKIEKLNIENLNLDWEKYLINYYPLLLPFFIAQITSAFTLPAVSSEIENQTIEHILVLPLSWSQIVFGKWLYYIVCNFLIANLIGVIYWVGTFFITSNVSVPYLTYYFLLLIPSIIIYVTSIALLVSSLTRETKVANIYSSILTWGLFLLIFFISWMTDLEISNIFIMLLSSIFSLVGLVCIYFLLRINTEKLII